MFIWFLCYSFFILGSSVQNQLNMLFIGLYQFLIILVVLLIFIGIPVGIIVYWSQKWDLNPAILLQHFSNAKKSIFSYYELSKKRLSYG